MRLPAYEPLFAAPRDMTQIFDRDCHASSSPKHDERGHRVDILAF
jgi:hypothetical protein